QTYSSESTRMTLSRGIVRASGTFSVAAALGTFVGSTFSMALAAWLMPRNQRPLSFRVLVISSASVLVTLLLCGSRTAFFQVGTILIAGIISSLLVQGTRKRMKAILLPQAFAIIGITLFLTVFSESYGAMKERQLVALDAEGSPIRRVLGPIASTVEVLPEMSLLGSGIGTGSPGGAVLGRGTFGAFLREDEWPRTLQESGIAGFLYIAYRIALSFSILTGAVDAARKRNNTMPLILFSFAGIILSTGHIIFQGTSNGYGWLFAGFCMAANKLGKTPVR